MRWFYYFIFLVVLFVTGCPDAIVEGTTTTSTTTTTIYIYINDSIPSPPKGVRLTFIHQKIGSSLLSSENDAYGNGHLALYLSKHNYYVTDITSGWDVDYSIFFKKQPIGDYTDIDDLVIWFNKGYEKYLMLYVFLNEKQYPNNVGMSYFNVISKPDTSNDLVVFKVSQESCIVDSTGDEVGIFKNVLEYTKTQNDKLFIFFTPPPKRVISDSKNTRWFCNYLSDTKDGWLKDYPLKNVGVFDMYNVLTGESNSHTADVTNDIIHIIDETSDNVLLEIYSDRSSDMVNTKGLIKVTQNFIPLLNYYYNRWKDIQYKE